MIKRGMRPPHPGSMIRDIIEGIKEESGQTLTVGEVAEGLAISRKTASALLNERQGISPEMAIRISEAFGSSAEFWLKLQLDYELWHANQKVDRQTIKRFLPLQKPDRQSA